jgi:hypothetical protein
MKTIITAEKVEVCKAILVGLPIIVATLGTCLVLFYYAFVM